MPSDPVVTPVIVSPTQTTVEVQFAVPGPAGPPGTTDWNELTNVPATFPPETHASEHVTGGSDKIRDATAAQDGLATAAQIAKLDGIAANANNYVHPNHSGDVTSVGDGATTIANGAVTLAKMANLSTNKLIGRHTAGSGVPQEVGLDGGIEFHGANIRREALTGDVTAAAGNNATTIANDAVTYAKMQNVSAASRLLGRGSSGGSGDVQEITLGSGLSMSGTTLSASGGGGGGDVAAETVAADPKTTPVDNDLLPLVDSADSNTLKKLSWSNLKATLKTWLESLTDLVLAALRVTGGVHVGANATAPLTAWVFEAVEDPANATVTAAVIRPLQNNGGRLYIGSSDRPLFSLNLSNVNRLENAPASFFGLGLYVGGRSNTFIERSGGGTAIGANHPNDRGLEIFHNNSFNDATEAHLICLVHRLHGISFYRLNVNDGYYERIAMTSDGSRFVIRPEAAGLGIVRPVDYHLDGSGLRLTSGSGTPEGAVTAPVGATYLRTDGGSGTTLYIKESGSGNTGWVAVASGSGITELTSDVTAGPGSGSQAATIAADAVTNTKLANMAAWTVKVRNNAASGDPSDVVASDLTEETTPAAGDFLLGWESGGALRKFDIGDLPGGSSVAGWVLVETRNLTSAGVEDFDLTGGADKYMFRFEGVYCSSDGYILQMLLSDDGGTTWIASGYEASEGTISATNYITLGFNTAAAQANLLPLVGSGTDDGVYGDLFFEKPLSTTAKTFWHGMLSRRNYNDSKIYVNPVGGQLTSPEANELTDAVRFKFSVGDMEGGTIKLYRWTD